MSNVQDLLKGAASGGAGMVGKAMGKAMKKKLPVDKLPEDITAGNIKQKMADIGSKLGAIKKKSVSGFMTAPGNVKGDVQLPVDAVKRMQRRTRGI